MEIEIVRSVDRDAGGPVARAVRDGLAERHGRHLFSLDGETIDSQVAKLLWGWRRPGPSRNAGKPAARKNNGAGRLRRHGGLVLRLLTADEAKVDLLGGL